MRHREQAVTDDEVVRRIPDRHGQPVRKGSGSVGNIGRRPDVVDHRFGRVERQHEGPWRPAHGRDLRRDAEDQGAGCGTADARGSLVDEPLEQISVLPGRPYRRSHLVPAMREFLPAVGPEASLICSGNARTSRSGAAGPGDAEARQEKRDAVADAIRGCSVGCGQPVFEHIDHRVAAGISGQPSCDGLVQTLKLVRSHLGERALRDRATERLENLGFNTHREGLPIRRSRGVYGQSVQRPEPGGELHVERARASGRNVRMHVRGR